MKIVSNNQTNIKKEISKSDDTVKIPGKGSTLKGKIIEVDGKKIVVEYKGNRFEGELELGSGRPNLKGMLADFLVLENTPNLKLSLMSDVQSKTIGSSEINSAANQLESLLSSLGLPKNDMNINVVSALKAFQIPVTKENIQELKEFLVSKNMLGEKLESLTPNTYEKSGTVIIDKERPVKEVLIDLIKQEGIQKETDSQSIKIVQTSKDANDISKIEIKNSDSVAGDNKSNKYALSLKLVDGNEFFKSASTRIDQNLLETIREASTRVQSDKTESKQNINKSELAILANEENQGENALKEIVNLLKSVDENSFLFNKELQLPNNIKNLYGFNKIVNMKDSLMVQLGRLMSNISDAKDTTTLNKLINDLQNIKADDVESLKSQIEKIEKELSDKGNLNNSLKESIENIKESVDYLKEINNQIFYMQVPLKVNDQIVDMELGFRHKSKTKDGSFKIFISLETHNLGLVQSLIKIKENDIELSLKVDDDQVEYFEDNLYMLEEELTLSDYKVISINLLERESRLDLSDLIKENTVDETSFNALV